MTSRQDGGIKALLICHFVKNVASVSHNFPTLRTQANPRIDLGVGVNDVIRVSIARRVKLIAIVNVYATKPLHVAHREAHINKCVTTPLRSVQCPVPSQIVAGCARWRTAGSISVKLDRIARTIFKVAIRRVEISRIDTDTNRIRHLEKPIDL